MELKYLSELFEEFKKSQQSNIRSYKTFCDGCKKHIEEIPTNYPAFISIGTSPVAGIGWGASELTKESQKKMSERWTSKYGPCLTKLKNNVEEGYIQELSKLVSEDRGRSLNLFVNRCIITLHNTDLFAIANIVDLKLLFELLNKIGINNVSYISNNNQNLEWYINNLKLFSQLKKELNVNDTDDARIELSSFGWYLKEKLLRSMLLEKTLEHCHNIILTGAPGTGKTYMAKEIAKQMGAAIKFTQFHPSYDYTDFVEGLRPEKKTRRNNL